MTMSRAVVVPGSFLRYVGVYSYTFALEDNYGEYIKQMNAASCTHMNSNAQEVLAQAMGRPAPPPPVPIATVPTMTVIEAQQSSEILMWAGRARNGLVITSLFLALLVIYIVVQAYRRHRGPRLKPVPWDYKEQKRLMSQAEADNK